MIYVPDVENYKCFVVQNEEVIRAYESLPKNNSVVDYRDYYINSSYIYKDGQQQFSNYATLPTCLAENVVTDSIYYRNDLPSIFIIFLTLAFVCLYCPYRIFNRLFRRYR